MSSLSLSGTLPGLAGGVAAAEQEGKGLEQAKTRAAIKATIKMDGILLKKTDNRVTGAVTMKKRYFCLTATQATHLPLSASPDLAHGVGPAPPTKKVSYYETEADMYAEDADALGAISMHQVHPLEPF